LLRSPLHCKEPTGNLTDIRIELCLQLPNPGEYHYRAGDDKEVHMNDPRAIQMLQQVSNTHRSRVNTPPDPLSAVPSSPSGNCVSLPAAHTPPPLCPFPYPILPHRLSLRLPSSLPQAVRDNDQKAYDEYAALMLTLTQQCTVRGMMTFKSGAAVRPISLDQVGLPIELFVSEAQVGKLHDSRVGSHGITSWCW
jgi:hypothetical protein